jgi:hypothetical protein
MNLSQQPGFQNSHLQVVTWKIGADGDAEWATTRAGYGGKALALSFLNMGRRGYAVNI